MTQEQKEQLAEAVFDTNMNLFWEGANIGVSQNAKDMFGIEDLEEQDEEDIYEMISDKLDNRNSTGNILKDTVAMIHAHLTKGGAEALDGDEVDNIVNDIRDELNELNGNL